MRSLRSLGVLGLTAVLATACQTADEAAEDSARMAADTGLAPSSPVPAGPISTVTGEDAGLVMDATEFEITDQNFQSFLRASEALSYLRARDMTVRTLLEQPASTPDSTAGSLLERLEQNPQVAQAIAGAGMSVRDYYVMAIAVAAAQRHSANPEGAPPTPVGRKNAEWAQKNQSQLSRLQTWGTAVAR